MRLPSLLVAAALLVVGAGSALAQPPGGAVAGVCQPRYDFPEPSTDPNPESFTFPLNCEVSTGAVVLLENPAAPAQDPHNWSDVLVFTNPGQPPLPGLVASFAILVSDTEDPATGGGITDAALAAAGVPMTTQQLGSQPNTIFLPENPGSPDNRYDAPGLNGQVIEYHVYSDPPTAEPAVAPPGSPYQPCPVSDWTLAEPQPQPGGGEGGEVAQISFDPCLMTQGVVVLVEDAAQDPRNPQNWSDVIVFWTPGTPVQPGTPAALATLVSDTDNPATGLSVGVTDADLAAAGVPITTAGILALPNTVYQPENTTSDENLYLAVNPAAGQALYHFFSDPPETPTPARAGTWGRVKGLYR